MQLLVYEVSSEDVRKFDIYDYSEKYCDMQVFPYFDSEVDFNGNK